jgi:hypothetical protein
VAALGRSGEPGTDGGLRNAEGGGDVALLPAELLQPRGLPAPPLPQGRAGERFGRREPRCSHSRTDGDGRRAASERWTRLASGVELLMGDAKPPARRRTDSGRGRNDRVAASAAGRCGLSSSAELRCARRCGGRGGTDARKVAHFTDPSACTSTRLQQSPLARLNGSQAVASTASYLFPGPDASAGDPGFWRRCRQSWLWPDPSHRRKWCPGRGRRLPPPPQPRNGGTRQHHQAPTNGTCTNQSP